MLHFFFFKKKKLLSSNGPLDKVGSYSDTYCLTKMYRKPQFVQQKLLKFTPYQDI